MARYGFFVYIFSVMISCTSEQADLVTITQPAGIETGNKLTQKFMDLSENELVYQVLADSTWYINHSSGEWAQVLTGDVTISFNEWTVTSDSVIWFPGTKMLEIPGELQVLDFESKLSGRGMEADLSDGSPDYVIRNVIGVHYLKEM